MTIAEASEFWDTHSVADYSSHIVSFDYEPDEQITIYCHGVAGQFVDGASNSEREG